MNSRTKGAVGEREVASMLRGYGYKARRGQQYSGANGDADVVGLPGIHIEVKRREKLNIYDAMQLEFEMLKQDNQAEETTDDGFLEAMNATAQNVWGDEDV